MLAKVERAVTPLVRNRIWVPGSELSFSAACFGGEGQQWSLGPLQEPDDVRKHPELAAAVREAVRHLGADRVWAPNPTAFNGEIVQPIELSRVLKLGKGVILFRHKERMADGTFLRHPEDAGIFSAGGCGVIVAVLHDRMLFAHMGRECLIDRVRVTTGKASRRRESVVDGALEAMLSGHVRRDVRDLHVWVLYTIRPEDFLHRYDDPDARHRTYNRLVGPDLQRRGLGGGMREVERVGVMLDLPLIARLQLMRHGVPESNIHLEHRYLSDELPHTRKGDGKTRYLVAIARH